MSNGSIIGFDINAKLCQVSYYDVETGEPETLETGMDYYQFPVAMAYYKNMWTYGKNAIRMSSVRGCRLVDNLFERALQKKKVRIDGDEYECETLFTDFVKQMLVSFKDIAGITFTVPEVNERIRVLLTNVAVNLGVEKEAVYLQDYKESFCHYMFNQPKELWQYEAALFHCDGNVIRTYMLKELKTGFRKGRERFVTVENAAEAEMKELESVYPVLNVDKAKAADEKFRSYILSVFDKRTVSSVFLTGEGFENNWYPASLRVLCNGRRAFMGNNLYSKGACYTAMRRLDDVVMDAPIYLDSTKMTEQICIKMRVRGEENWFPLVAWGSHWYECDKTIEVLMENTQDLEVHVESLVTGKLRVETVSFEGMPERKNYSVRMSITTRFTDEYHCHIVFEDVGFGEFFPSTGFRTETVIELGGSNGQFSSLP